MNERISELLDGELDDAAAQRQIAALKEDDGLRRTWDTYHLIGDAIRGHIAMDLSAKVASRLRDEPTILAPRPAPHFQQLRKWSFSAAAAGVAAIALASWLARPTAIPDEQIVRAPAAVTQPAPAAPSGVENYLLAHQPFSSTSAMQGMAPYVRTVSQGQPRDAGR